MPDTAKIRDLNDAFRLTMTGGRVVVTNGIANRNDLAEIIERVRSFDAFDADNDPDQEHDFAGFKIGDQQIFWKIDYYDVNLDGGSPNPMDPAVTCRVMTVMLAEEY